jgi:hypothetical protein
MIPKTVEDCWRIAFNEAERYQKMLTERMSGEERVKYKAKRDAASRIAPFRNGSVRGAECRQRIVAPRSASQMYANILRTWRVPAYRATREQKHFGAGPLALTIANAEGQFRCRRGDGYPR